MRRACTRGFSLITAIFLLVVLAALGAFILTVSGTQQTSSALDIDSARAYHAARTGIEWGAWQVLDPNNDLPGVGGTANLPPCPAASTNLTGLAGTLSGFTVTVTCDSSINAPTTEGNRNVGAYRLVATACNQPDGAGACPNPAATTFYVERQLQATLSKCKDPAAAAPRFSCG